jgi:hypothetical protein
MKVTRHHDDRGVQFKDLDVPLPAYVHEPLLPTSCIYLEQRDAHVELSFWRLGHGGGVSQCKSAPVPRAD